MSLKYKCQTQMAPQLPHPTTYTINKHHKTLPTNTSNAWPAKPPTLSAPVPSKPQA